MPPYRPRTQLVTHEVTNQPPPLEDYNLFETNPPLQEALEREGGGGWSEQVTAYGTEMGRAETIEDGRLANKHLPEFMPFDRYGGRIDEVQFHPSYHRMLKRGLEAGIASNPWGDTPGGHVAHTALHYLHSQIEPGTGCPITMTYAAVPALKTDADLAAEWLPRITGSGYDPASRPAAEKSAATIGMAMTEKQGGSDVRANTTKAYGLGGSEYELTGHKWFCSAPMCDAFLTLAYTDEGLTCFLVPRWRPDGTRNQMHIQRLKDKLGNRSNASAEIEYHGAYARRLGEDGRGVATIIEMVHHTRLDTALAPAAFMRAAFVQAVHHTMHRRAFQRALIDQPMMQGVLADLALEVEASLLMVMRVARAYDEAAGSDEARTLSRLTVALAKYWNNKRCPNFIYEAMECLGGAGYVEESCLPLLYREAPLNSIWEGSGNVICLDILRTLEREPAALPALLTEIELATGGHGAFDTALVALKDRVAKPIAEVQARQLAAQLALLLQASLMIRHAPNTVSDAFCATRLGGERSQVYGVLPEGTPAREIIARNWPAAG